jgi:ABC-2 type transport system permease protein
LLNLIMNENMKIYRRIRTWILVAILLVIEGLAYWIYYKNGGTGSTPSMWKAVLFGSNLISVPLFLSVIIAADSVAGEFSGGTIKLLLIRPASRAKILLSKYISVFGFLLLLLLILLVTSFIVSGLLYGFGSTTEIFSYSGRDGVMHQISYASETFRSYGLGSVNLIMILTLAFMVSTVLRSSAIAITLSIVSIFVGGTNGELIKQYSWAKYYLFLNTDLSKYFTQSAPALGSDTTLQFSIMILIVYFVIFNGLSWYVFKKRDVAS